MKTIASLIGVLLIIIGVMALVYQGISYTKQEKVAQIGDIQVTADTQKTLYFSPMLGGVSLVVGVALVLLGRRNGK